MSADTAEVGGLQQPRSPLELQVLGLRDDMLRHKDDPGFYHIEWLCDRVADVIRYDVSEADKRIWKAIPTPEDRVTKQVANEPYRTQVKRIDTELHDPKLRWRKRRAVLGPLLERAAEESIADLAELCRRRRRTST